MRSLLGITIVLVPSLASAALPSPTDLRNDAALVEQLINRHYAYLERLPDGKFILPAKLQLDGARIVSKHDLIDFSERALSLLADHHAITGSSTTASWAVFPSYGDLWVQAEEGSFVIEEVRRKSPAEEGGIRRGDRLIAINGVPTAVAVKAYWDALGATAGGDRNGYAARVLAAGRRDRPRSLTVQRGLRPPRTLTLQNLYRWRRADPPPVSTAEQDGALIIRINDALGDDRTISAFDAAVAGARPNQRLVIDLTETPSGGNTTIARGILGWFVTKPTAYQLHNLPAEERRTGIARQWLEQVLPRPGKYHAGKVIVRVGRWTGSMGEGLAIGFAANGARIEGSRMAGLLGAIHDYRLPSSGLLLKIPTERLYTVKGLPREGFVPERGVARDAATQ